MIHIMGEFYATELEIARFIRFMGDADINPPLRSEVDPALCEGAGCLRSAEVNFGSMNFCASCAGSAWVQHLRELQDHSR